MSNRVLARQTVQVWDPFVRIFHWSLAISCILNLWFLEGGDSWHEWTGYYAAGAVVARVVWGFIGTPYARFRSFWPSPHRLKEYLTALFHGRHLYYVGHNPLGSLMILALMLLVLLLGLTGWMQELDRFWGDETIMALHEVLSDILMILILIHVSIAILYSLFGEENLIKAMITGRKPRR